MGYVPQKLPLPGVQGFKAASRAAEQKLFGNSQNRPEMWEYNIPRRYILFSPRAIRANKNFKHAISYALQASDDRSKFRRLERVFEAFGYYYPYWIVTGGKFLYEAPTPLHGRARPNIRTIITKQMRWKALGGNESLLVDSVDIEGWLESTSQNQAFIMSLDVNPTYDLLDEDTRSEVQRIYETQYAQFTPDVDSIMLSHGGMSDTLNYLSKVCLQNGFAKGVHFGGSLSAEYAIQLVDKGDIGKMIVPLCVDGKPRITCHVRRTMLAVKASAHAFTHSDDAVDSVNECVFSRAAVSKFIETNGGELQPATRGVRYFVLYAICSELILHKNNVTVTDDFKEAVRKALGSESDKKRYRALQDVFGRFGYYYPSSILLGGRILYKLSPVDPPESWLVNNGTSAINTAIKKETYLSDSNIEKIGGGTMFMDAQEWIDSVKENQQRVQFTELKPIYELLDEELRLKVLRLYEKMDDHLAAFPKLPNAIQLDGSAAAHQALELAENNVFSKMVMLKQFSSQPHLEHVKHSAKNPTDIQRYASWDIESDQELPGNFGFISGALGAYKELPSWQPRHYGDIDTAYHLAYVTYKELHLYDEFIRPSKSFKEAIQAALRIGSMDTDTYYALQDVFQSFGYYYPSSIRFGGRVLYEVAPEQYKEQLKIGGSKQHLLLTDSKLGSEKESAPMSATEQTEDHGETSLITRNNATAMTKTNVSRELATITIQSSIEKSLQWNAIGGNSQLLLLNGVKDWLDTVETNPAVTQFRGLRPLYELLDDDLQSKIQQTYENVVMMDERIPHNYLVQMTAYRYLAQISQHNSHSVLRVPTDELFINLTENTFPDSKSAVEFCRTSCMEFGFSIVTKHGLSTGATSKSPTGTESHAACQWGVMLFENEEGKWSFQKLSDPEESLHNHELDIAGREEERTPCDGRRSPTSAADGQLADKAVFKLCKDSASDMQNFDIDYLKYGDVVRIYSMRQEWDTRLFRNPNCIGVDSLGMLGYGIPGSTSSGIDIKDCNFQWKIVRCPMLSGVAKNETTESNNDKTFSNGKRDIACAEVSNLTQARELNSKTTTDEVYVQRGDIVALQSLKVLDDGSRVFLSPPSWCLNTTHLKEISEDSCAVAGWHMDLVNQYENIKKSNNMDVEGAHDGRMLEYARKRAAENDPDNQYYMGSAYLHGLHDLQIDKGKAMEYFKQASDQGYGQALYEIGNIYWDNQEYQKAIDIFEKASSYPVFEACRKLGDMYHNGLISQSSETLPVSQDRETAFLYYSIGGIFGDSKASLTVAEYLEKGYQNEFGVDVSRALRWYELVDQTHRSPFTQLAIANVKHSLATKQTEPSKIQQLRREAYDSYEAAALDEPYARFMVAVYHLYGWSYQDLDPKVAFGILLSLAESGNRMVLMAIATCYTKGVGVDRDIAKASAFRRLAQQ
ncbi:hypothetical protein EC973_004604 [Apophysomyces ossiformis]|uniref:MACPF domain-containing protein n=1 Tax=Apophysomyces ossiformis TaxID=679940 RepID=A0A8H7EUW0_9FUNG|nr:hypothetical protein EC973_004604 [Apophysomyces ossiformis]